MIDEDFGLEETEAATPADAAPPEKGKRRLPLYLGIAAGAVILIIAVAVFVYSQTPDASPQPTAGAAPAAVAAPPPPAASQPEKIQSVLTLDPTVANLSDLDSKPRFARVQVSLGLSRDLETQEADRKAVLVPLFKDCVLDVLNGKTSADLLRPDGKHRLKAEILARLNSLLQTEDLQIVEVYFTEFIVQ